MIAADLQAEVLTLCYKIAPELRGPHSGAGGLYLFDSKDLAKPEPACLAYASRFLHPLERQWLEDNGQFAGPPSGVITFCTDAIRAAAENFNRCLLEIALHEICHLLPAPTEIERAAKFGPRMTAAIEEGHRQLVESPPAGIDEVLKEDHADRFCRVAAHVWFRAAALGIIPAAHHMFAGWKYGLSHPHQYLEALGDEPLRLLHEDFATIEKTPQPAAFKALWEADRDHLCHAKEESL